jgi:hypothetical protein
MRCAGAGSATLEGSSTPMTLPLTPGGKLGTG